MTVGLVAYFLLRAPETLREGELTGIPAEFFRLVPEDLPVDQRAEIEGLLKRFQSKGEAGQIRAEDYQEVMQLFAKYLTKGSIDRSELNLLMAKVGYYSYRAASPDSSDIHPLLTPAEAPRDTSHVNHTHD